MTEKTNLLIPQPLGKNITFRWFVEYVVDSSPLFSTASAIAKASMLLAADLDTPGVCPVDSRALSLLRQAVTSDEHPLALPPLMVTQQGAEGAAAGEPVPVPPRAYAGFIGAIVNDAPEQLPVAAE